MTDTATSVRYVGGPLDGQDAENGKAIYRSADGAAASATYGDDRLMRGAWQPCDSGMYSLAHGVYR